MAGEAVELSVSMPPSGSGLQANMKVAPILSVPSKLVEIRYKVPFGLNVEPKNQLCVCTKDGPGGEKEGDVLRYTSQWTIGLPSGGGIISTAASFSGGVSWQCSLFNVLKAKSWEQVVGALTSNVEVSEVGCCTGECASTSRLPYLNSHHFALLWASIHSPAPMKLSSSSNDPSNQHPSLPRSEFVRGPQGVM